MANGYSTCPTCGCPQPGHWQGAQMPPWQGGQMWAGPAWGTQGMGMAPGGYTQPCPPTYGPGPVYGYVAPYTPAYYGGLPTDSEIEEMIYDSIDADPLIPFDASIDISVEAGTVYLRGEVPSKRIKHAAGDDAWWIPGVVDVHNEIKVTPRRGKQEGGEEHKQS